jgi:uncharacterized protein GlcG (DUF336 family)
VIRTHVSRALRVCAFAVISGIAASSNASAQITSCTGLPSYGALKLALDAAVAAETSGFNLQMWATIVDRDGIVCAVAYSGVPDRGAQWPGSRVISAQKANTANAFSLQGLALSTANLYSAVQPGGSLFGLQESNPVNTVAAYAGADGTNYGTVNDPMKGLKIGGVNVFGGGLGLYGPGRVLMGGVGLSGDTSCADHNIAWRVRKNLGLDHLQGVGGVSGDAARPDNIVYDLKSSGGASGSFSKSGWGHPECVNTGDPSALPAVVP